MNWTTVILIAVMAIPFLYIAISWWLMESNYKEIDRACRKDAEYWDSDRTWGDDNHE